MKPSREGTTVTLTVKRQRRKPIPFLMLCTTALIVFFSITGCIIGRDTETKNKTEENVIFRGQNVPLQEGMSLNQSVKPYFTDNAVICLGSIPREVQKEDDISVVTDEVLIKVDLDGVIAWTQELPLSDEENIISGILYDDGFSLLVADSGGNSYILQQTDEKETRIALPASEESFIFLTEDSERKLWAASRHELFAMDKDGSLIFSIPFDNPIQGMAAGEKGAWIILYDGSASAVSIGPDGTINSKVSVSYAEGITVDDGILYISADNGVIQGSGGTFALFVDYLKSNLSSSAARLLSVPDKDHVLFARSTGFGYELAVFHRRASDEAVASKTLEIGCATRYGLSQYLTDRIVLFNSSHEEIQVQVTDYHDIYSDITAAEEALARDLVTGIYRPDLLIYDLGEECAYQRAAVEHGLTLDLTAYLNMDEKLNTANMFGSALRGCQYGGTIWGLPINMTLSTLVVPDSQLGKLSSHEKWTLTEELDFLESLPADVTPCVDCSQDTALEALLGMNGLGMFLDFEKGRCSFDSEEFIRLLRYISGRPKNWDELIQVSPADKAMYNQRAQYYYSGQVAMKRFYVTSIPDFISLGAQFGTDEVTKIGYPVKANAEKGAGIDVTLRDTLSVTSFCDVPTDAWEFLRYAVTCERGSAAGITFLAAYKPNLSGQAQIGSYTLFKMDGTSITDTLAALENMNKNGFGIIRELTQGDVDALAEILDNAGVSLMETVPSTVKEIVWEEISAMTAGVSTPEECAKKIQSRASLWMAEHR